MSNFKSLNYVPRFLRKLHGTPLSMNQIDEILDKANKDADGPNDFARALGISRIAFMEKYEVFDGIWSLKKAEKE